MRTPNTSPKGLFDPMYVPNTLLHRDRELNMIKDVYTDSYDDDYGINVCVHGVQGVGMTVFSRYFLTKLVPEAFDAFTVYVDAKNKDTKSIVIKERLTKLLTILFQSKNCLNQIYVTCAASIKTHQPTQKYWEYFYVD